MAFETIDQTTKTRTKKPTVLLVSLLVLLIIAATYTLCSVQYQAQRQKTLAEQATLLQTRTTGVVRSVALWLEALDIQAKRVSSSELYGLFAFEVQQLDKNVISSLDATGSLASSSGDLLFLVEQIPLMRDVLLDYMNYSGMRDVRLVNRDGLTLLTALARPMPINETQLFAAKKAIELGSIAFAPVRDSLGGLMLDFADPIVPMHDSEAAAKSEVALVLTTPVTGTIAQFLAREQGHSENIQARFVQYDGTVWESLQVNAASPLPFNLQLDLNTNETSLPFQRVVTVDGKEAVYVSGVKIEALNWWVLAQVPESVVNAELQGLAWVIYGIGTLISAGFILLLALLWWVIVGREQRAIADRFKELYTVIKQQKHLLDCVNVSLDVGIFMTDSQGLIQLCNKAFADIMRKDEHVVLRTSLSALFDAENVGTLLQAMRKVDESETTQSLEMPLTLEDDSRLLRITLFPFVDTNEEEDSRGVVGIIQDITEFRRRSQQHQLQQHNTIRALVQAIEGVDPYLTGHSQLMEKIAEIVANKLGLDNKDCNTIRIAAGLSQLGKLFVPRNLLTKSQNLTEEEQAQMMEIPDYAYQVLKNIDFGLPVAEAVYSMYEKMDGSGYPRALKGSEIAIHARVLAVVNAFCAMSSPRSYRSGMSLNAVMAVLHADTTCDSNVVNALKEALNTPECVALLHSKEQNLQKEKA